MSSKDKQQAKNVVIEKNIVIDASPEVVFKAITDRVNKLVSRSSNFRI
jgi:hypothetical protein